MSNNEGNERRVGNKISNLQSILFGQGGVTIPLGGGDPDRAAQRLREKLQGRVQEYSISKEHCLLCDTAIQVDEQVLVENGMVHMSCMFCTVCGISLSKDAFKYDPKAKSFYCDEHFVGEYKILDVWDDIEQHEYDDLIEAWERENASDPDDNGESNKYSTQKTIMSANSSQSSGSSCTQTQESFEKENENVSNMAVKKVTSRTDSSDMNHAVLRRPVLAQSRRGKSIHMRADSKRQAMAAERERAATAPIASSRVDRALSRDTITEMEIDSDTEEELSLEQDASTSPTVVVVVDSAADKVPVPTTSAESPSIASVTSRKSSSESPSIQTSPSRKSAQASPATMTRNTSVESPDTLDLVKVSSQSLEMSGVERRMFQIGWQNTLYVFMCTSVSDRVQWCNALNNQSELVKLQSALQTAQKVDMLQVIQAQMNLEGFSESHQTGHKGAISVLKFKKGKVMKKAVEGYATLDGDSVMRVFSGEGGKLVVELPLGKEDGAEFQPAIDRDVMNVLNQPDTNGSGYMCGLNMFFKSKKQSRRKSSMDPKRKSSARKSEASQDNSRYFVETENEENGEFEVHNLLAQASYDDANANVLNRKEKYEHRSVAA